MARLKSVITQFKNAAVIRSVVLSTLVLILLSYSWMFEMITVPNERSRVYLATALVDDHSIQIDKSIRRFGRTIDVAKYEGHFYTDKAPGSSILGAAVYGIARMFTPKEDWTIGELINLMRSYLMIPIGLIGFLLLRRFLQHFNMRDNVIDVVSLAWIAASPAYHYSAAFYGHQIVAVALLAALILILKAQRDTHCVGLSLVYLVIAGMAAGVAGITEYQSAFPCFMLLIYVIAREYRHPTRIAFFLLGAAPFVVVLLGYQWLAFGGPFELSYHHLVSKSMQVQHHFGLGGVTYPKGPAIVGNLFSLHRGLLFTAPAFLLLPFGVFLMAKQKERLLATITGLVFTFYLLFVFSAAVWHGGWGFGNRLLVPCFLLSLLPVAWAVNRMAKSTIAMGVICGMVTAAMFYHQLIHLVYQEPPDFSQNPLYDIILPAFQRGIVAPNLAYRFTKSPGLWNIIPALTIVAILSGYVVWQGVNAIKGRFKKLVTILITLLVVAAFAATLIVVGPTWKPKKIKRFNRSLHNNATAEYGYLFEPRKTK